jgi:HlyD family secretion protein
MRSNVSPLALSLLLVACAEAKGSSGLLESRSPWIATAVGRVDSANEARHLPAATDGILAKVFVRRGDQVTAGQPLIDIDCSPLVAEAEAREADAARAASASRAMAIGTSADREIARAAVDAAIAELSNEEGQLRRADDIYRRGFLSRSGYDTRVQRHVAAQSALRSAKARLDDLESGRRTAELVEASAAAKAARYQATRSAALVEQCTVRSPIAGQVLQIMRREGEHSGASQGVPLIVIGDLSHLVVRAEVGERDAARIRTGQRAEIWIDGNSRHWSGTVTDTARIMGRRSARSLDPTDRFDRDIREVFIAFDGPAPPALVGLRVTVGLLK